MLTKQKEVPAPADPSLLPSSLANPHAPPREDDRTAESPTAVPTVHKYLEKAFFKLVFSPTLFSGCGSSFTALGDRSQALPQLLFPKQNSFDVQCRGLRVTVDERYTCQSVHLRLSKPQANSCMVSFCGIFEINKGTSAALPRPLHSHLLSRGRTKLFRLMWNPSDQLQESS